MILLAVLLACKEKTRRIKPIIGSIYPFLREKERSTIPLYNRVWVCFLLNNRAMWKLFVCCQEERNKWQKVAYLQDFFEIKQ